jgi:hypothetical protein
MNGRLHYLDWWFIHISVANLTVIVLMVIVFVLAVMVPYPKPWGGNR